MGQNHIEVSISFHYVICQLVVDNNIEQITNGAHATRSSTLSAPWLLPEIVWYVVGRFSCRKFILNFSFDDFQQPVQLEAGMKRWNFMKY